MAKLVQENKVSKTLEKSINSIDETCIWKVYY